MPWALSDDGTLIGSASRSISAAARWVAAVMVLALAPLARAAAADQAAVTRGAYVFAAAGCVSCHTDTKHDGAPLAGGRALATPFGTFYGPNITPDPRTGIGRWSEADLAPGAASGQGQRRRFSLSRLSLPSFTGMSDQDIADLYAYLMAQKPVVRANTPHAVRFPFGFRPLLFFWRTLFFTEGPLTPLPGRSAQWNRGRYLVEAVGHCEECHTPRNFLGALDHDRAFAGNPDGPNGEKAPNITPDDATGIGKWSLDDIETVLDSGETPGS